MRFFHGVVVSLLFMAIITGCGKDEKRDQEIQKAMEKGVKAEKQMYEGSQKNIEALEKGVQEQQQKDKK